MRLTYLYCILALLCFGHISGGQTIFDMPFNAKTVVDKSSLQQAIANIKTAEGYMAAGAYSKALPHYLIANQINPANAKLNRAIGECYMRLLNPIYAIVFFDKAHQLLPEMHHHIYFQLATAYHQNYEWDKAIFQYKKYINHSELKKENQNQQKIAQKRIQECNNGIHLEVSPLNIRILNLGDKINSQYDEYCPLITADESLLLFTSRRNTTTGGLMVPGADYYYEDVYYSEKVRGSWEQVKNIGPPVNTKKHNATVGLAADGQKMLVYTDDGKDGNLYESTIEGAIWGQPKKLNKQINSKYHEPSGCYSADGNSLYFISNRPGGEGEKDIYLAKLNEEGEWGEPTNVGNVLNTPYNEDGVFMHPDGKTMYFSSQGHTSIGGYDIFKSVLDQNTQQWSTPQNIGFPINTPLDDVFFVLSADGKHGYYTSVQPGGLGKKDLYLIQFENDWTDYTDAGEDVQIGYDTLKAGILDLNSALNQTNKLSNDLITLELNVDYSSSNAEMQLVNKKRQWHNIQEEVIQLDGFLDSLERYIVNKDGVLIGGSAELNEALHLQKLKKLQSSVSANMDSIEAVLRHKTAELIVGNNGELKYHQLQSKLQVVNNLTSSIVANFTEDVITHEKELIDLKSLLEESTDIVFMMANNDMSDMDKLRYIDSLEQRVETKQSKLDSIRTQMNTIQSSLKELNKVSNKATKNKKENHLNRIKQLSNIISSKVIGLNAILSSSKRQAEINNKNTVTHPSEISAQYEVVKMTLQESNKYARELLERKSGSSIYQPHETPKLVMLTGHVLSEENNRPIKAKIEVLDNEKDRVLAILWSNSSTGKYLITLPAGKNYGLIISAKEHLFYSENIDIPNLDAYTEVKKDIVLKSVSKGKTVVLSNIFFDYGHATLRHESVNELKRVVKLLNENPKLRIQISGHTDNQGSLEHNLQLSKNRAKAVYDHLISANIPANRLTYLGYGPKQPLEKNDTEEGRSKNRRTEFKVI